MSPWISAVVIPLAIVAIDVGMKFYFRWVPDVRDQKRQVVQFIISLESLVIFASAGVSFHLFLHDNGPINGAFVLLVALSTSLPVLWTSLLFTWGISYFLLPPGRSNLDSQARMLGITGGVIDALKTLARDPNLSKDTTDALHVLLYGGRKPASEPRSGRTTAS